MHKPCSSLAAATLRKTRTTSLMTTFSTVSSQLITSEIKITLVNIIFNLLSGHLSRCAHHSTWSHPVVQNQTATSSNLLEQSWSKQSLLILKLKSQSQPRVLILSVTCNRRAPGAINIVCNTLINLRQQLTLRKVPTTRECSEEPTAETTLMQLINKPRHSMTCKSAMPTRPKAHLGWKVWGPIITKTFSGTTLIWSIGWSKLSETKTRSQKNNRAHPTTDVKYTETLPPPRTSKISEQRKFPFSQHRNYHSGCQKIPMAFKIWYRRAIKSIWMSRAPPIISWTTLLKAYISILRAKRIWTFLEIATIPIKVASTIARISKDSN